jgi:parallel beta-helix repeat protein
MMLTRHSLLRQLGCAITSAMLRQGLPAAVMLRSNALAARGAPSGPNVFSIVDRGATGDGIADCTASIRAALADAARSGSGVVFIPPGDYVYSGTLLIGDNVAVIAALDSVLTARSERQAVMVKGDNVVLRGLQLRSDATQRKQANHSHAIAAVKVRNLLIEDCVITGASAGGIYLEGCQDFVIRNNTVSRTLADTIHMTGGSTTGIVSGNMCLSGGDDGVAVVSYAPQRVICRDIFITNNTVIGSRARGIAVVGGTNVRISDNRIEDTKWAGIYLASEESYDTYAASRISVDRNALRAVNRSSDSGNHACITVVGRPGSSLARTGEIPNQNRAILLLGNKVQGDGKDGIRVDRFTRDITIIANAVADTNGWGIRTSAFGAALIGNRVERASHGGILVGRECPGGKTDLVGNEIYLMNGPRQPGILLEPSRLADSEVRANRLQYDQDSQGAIRIADTIRATQRHNIVNGRLMN